MCTSEVGENPAGDAPIGSFRPSAPLFSASDSDTEPSSMALSPAFDSNDFNPTGSSSAPIYRAARASFNFNPEKRGEKNTKNKNAL